MELVIPIVWVTGKQAWSPVVVMSIEVLGIISPTLIAGYGTPGSRQ